jgi:hypothetical protein
VHKPDPVETILARLMPAALSDEGQLAMEAMLDELAGGAAVEVIPMKPWFRRPFAGGIAAAGIAAALLLPLAISRTPVPAPVVSAEQKPEPGFVLVSESGSVESMSEEGWQEDADGLAMRTMRLRVVEENQLLDEETGIVMLVSQPRDEYLLTPVCTF